MCPSTRWLFVSLACFLIQSCVQVISTYTSGKFNPLGSGNDALDKQAQDLEKNEVVLMIGCTIVFLCLAVRCFHLTQVEHNPDNPPSAHALVATGRTACMKNVDQGCCPVKPREATTRLIAWFNSSSFV